MANIIDDTIYNMRKAIWGNDASVGFFTYFDFSKFFLYAFLSLLAWLVIYRIFKTRPAVRLIAAIIFGIIFFAGASVTGLRELIFTSEIFLFLVTVRGFYMLLLWIPIRAQYRPEADVEISRLLMKGALSPEDSDRLYLLRRQSRETYERNVRWLFNPASRSKDPSL